jgi:hypothetical protein
MQDAVITLVVVVAIVSALVAIYTLVSSGRSYGDIGSGGIDPGAEPPDSGAQAGDREQEIRDMLDARNARRERRGEAPQVLDDELAALLRPAVGDAELREEARAVVDARNRRRVSKGLEPLDVEAEIDRHLRELN